MTTFDRSRLAWPGDVDLDLDVDATTLTSVVVMGDHEIWMRCTGGFGRWVNAAGVPWECPPGDPRADHTEVDLMVGFPTAAQTPELFDSLVERLQGWRDRAVPLRICSAPGRLTTIIEDQGSWICLPRKEHEELPGRS